MATETSPSSIREDCAAGSCSGAVREADDEISVLDVLIILAERKHLILSVALAFGVVAAVASVLLPKRYTATTTILPPQQSSSVGAALASQLGNLGGVAALAGGSLGIKNPNDMLISLMESRTVEDSMVRRFGLMEEYHDRYQSEARHDLAKHTTLDGSGKDGLIHLSIQDRDPNRAAELANGYVDEFRRQSEHLAITEASQRRMFFERQLEEAKNKLANAEQALKVTEQQTGLIQLDSQARALIESAASLRGQIAAKEVQVKSLETFATGENAQLIQAQQELASLQTQLAKLGGSGNGSTPGLIIPQGKVTEAGLEYVRKFRDVKYYETIFDILARQFEIAKLDEAKQGALIQVVDVAVPPDRRSFPKRSLIVLAGSVLGFAMGILFAFLHAAYLRMRSDTETEGKLRVLRELMRLSHRRYDRVA